MRLADAIDALHRAGYRASPCPTLAGWVVVLDPVRVQGTSETAPRVEYHRVETHASQVARFLSERN
jgi:hypothetical protein